MTDISPTPELPPIDQRPLITFALFAYNQKKYIREALEGALAQTYEPLEVILSDDCSNDGTFDEISKCVAEYKGSHQIVINRNHSNLGIAGHLNTVMNLANGVLIVAAAGDDISSPDRVEHLVSEWYRQKKKDLMCSDYGSIDSDGRILGEGTGRVFSEIDLSKIAERGVLGATAAWTPKLWTYFGELPSNLVHEDLVLPFRAAMLNGVGYTAKKLVMYRRGVSTWINRSQTVSPEEMAKRSEQVSYNAIVTAHAQIGDAIKANRTELILPIQKRLQSRTVEYLLRSKKVPLVTLLLTSLTSPFILGRLLRAIVATKFKNLYRVVLLIRRLRGQ